MFKSIIIISILILNILIINWNFDLSARDLDNEITNTTTPRSNKYSRDGAFDWGPIEVVSEPIPNQNNNNDESNYPQIVNENDKIYVVWEDRTDYNGAGEDFDIFFRYFDGIEWSDIQVISEPVVGQNVHTKDSRRPAIAVENGKIYVVWEDSNNIDGAGPDADIFYRCNLTGTSWKDIEVISEPIPGSFLNNMASFNPKIDVENGKIYVVWDDASFINNAGGDCDIFFRCNLTGASWEDLQIISEPEKGKNINTLFSTVPDIVVENNKIYVTWKDKNNINNAAFDADIFYRCNITNNNWEEIQVISEPISGWNFNVEESGEPSIAVENDKIYIIWHDYNDTDGAGIDGDISYRCNLTGYTWEPIQVISEPVPGDDNNVGDSTYPSIALENGKIYVVWCDYDNIDGAGTDGDIFYRRNITGVNWENIQIISEPITGTNLNTGTSAYPNIAVKLGKNHIVWLDNNNTNGASVDNDIFYLSIYSPVVLGLQRVTPILGNTSTDFYFRVAYFHLNNVAPSKIIANINGTEYSMVEVDPADTNYVDGKDYFYNIKNLDIGVHTYQFYASDSNFTLFTTPVNRPWVYNTQPKISTENNLIAIEDVYYEVDYEYEDIDNANIGQIVSFSNFSTNALWLKFNYNSGILNGTPTNDDVGEYWVNISINDTMDIDYTNFTLTVINVNDAPIITTDDIDIINEDELYEVEYKAVDVDSLQESLFWNMQTNASWLDFEHTTAKLSGIPENDDVGESWVSISVSDTEYINYSNFTLLVTNVNDPPKIITKNNITAIEDEFYEVHYFAEDIDNASSQLTWSIATNALWLTYNTDKAVINGTPMNDDIGEYWVNISVSDNEFIDLTNFTLVVININDPPMITTEDKTEITVGELFSINYEAEDIDPPPITLTWSVNSNASDWLTIDAYNGWLNGIPSVNDAGIYWVNVTVTDVETGWDYHNFTLKVLKKPVQVNYAPQLFNTSISPSEGDIKTEFTFSIHYFDEDGDVPVFIEIVIDGEDHELKLKSGKSASNGTYEYSITLSEGLHNYYFIAFDGFETVRTNNLTTPDIKNIGGVSTEETSWYWLFLIVIIIIIIGIVIALLIMKKRKAMKLPSVQAEILRAPPEHIALPGATYSADIAPSLSAQPIISEQLPSPKVQVQPPEGTIPGEIVPAPSLAPTTIETQFQLPQATLSKTQKLELLEERFLRGEVDLETYKELKTKIEAHTAEDITKDESEEQSTIPEHQQQVVIEEPISEESTPISTPELVGKPPLESVIEPQFKAQQLQPKQQETAVAQTEQTPQELSPNLEVDVQKQQTTQSQSSTQTQQQLKPIEKGKTNQK